jgi:hypothetical protein
MLILRDMASGESYCNATARNLYGLKKPLGNWMVDLRWFHPDDVPKIEDAHSKVLKIPNAEFTYKVRTRLNPLGYILLEHIVMADYCPHCKTGCALVCMLILTP